MKKLIAVLLTLVIVFPLAACGGKKTGTESTDPAVPATDGSGETITDANGNVLPANLPAGAINGIRETFDPMEYTIYMNVFQDISSKQFDGIEMDKKGTFAILQDDWSGKTRYYVWGYNDTTRCCDYPWEFVPADVSALPEPVRMPAISAAQSIAAVKRRRKTIFAGEKKAMRSFAPCSSPRSAHQKTVGIINTAICRITPRSRSAPPPLSVRERRSQSR